MPKCIIILSTKSAGSSAVQEMLSRFAGGRTAEHTRHGEQETLYWTKAASILGLRQLKLPDSEVPIESRKAESELRTFISQNAPEFRLPAASEDMIFGGWRALTLHYAPVFVEKSPHHLHQAACLDLMTRAMHLNPDIDFRFVGLVRNPMDVLYSAWTRWRTPPEELQHHWGIAYENLERFRETVGAKLVVVRYEDFNAQSDTSTRLTGQLGLRSPQPGIESFIHSGARLKWKSDSRFGFRLDPSVESTAKRFGYTESELRNDPRRGWRFYSRIARARHQLYNNTVVRIRRKLRSA